MPKLLAKKETLPVVGVDRATEIHFIIENCPICGERHTYETKTRQKQILKI